MPFYKTKSIGKVVIAISASNAVPNGADYIHASPLLQDEGIWALLSACWATDPERRPSVEEIVGQLKGFQIPTKLNSDLAVSQ